MAGSYTLHHKQPTIEEQIRCKDAEGRLFLKTSLVRSLCKDQSRSLWNRKHWTKPGQAAPSGSLHLPSFPQICSLPYTQTRKDKPACSPVQILAYSTGMYTHKQSRVWVKPCKWKLLEKGRSWLWRKTRERDVCAENNRPPPPSRCPCLSDVPSNASQTCLERLSPVKLHTASSTPGHGIWGDLNLRSQAMFLQKAPE